MSSYRIRTLRDAQNAVKQSGLESWDWSSIGTLVGFTNWLLTRAEPEIDSKELADTLTEYLSHVERSMQDVDPCQQDVLDTEPTIAKFNAQVAELGAAVARVRAEADGDATMHNIVELATTSDPDRYIKNLGHDCLGAIINALQTLWPAASYFSPSLYEPYDHGFDDIKAFLIAKNAWRLDTLLSSELEWDGRSEYQVMEVAAIVKLVQDQHIFANVAESFMQVRIANQAPPSRVQAAPRRRQMGI